MAKNIFASKTFWLNLGMALLPVLIPAAQGAVADHPAVATGLAAALNILNRFFTVQPVTLTASDKL